MDFSAKVNRLFKWSGVKLVRSGWNVDFGIF